MKRKKRIVVGMSGGVDSSVTVALLKKRGFEVIGVTLQLLPKEDAVQSACCNLDAIEDAKRVAYKLKIPHYTANSREVFQNHVISPFIASYAKGQTPNPCVECNRYIKFDELWKKAQDIGGDYMATGHYSRIVKRHKTNIYELREAKDTLKDQSYFLYMLGQDQLKKLKFPLGHYTKPEIRKIAETLNLINAKKKDSQEICFVAQKSYKDYVKPHLTQADQAAGPIVNLAGDKIGNHQGLYQYTVGQRKGLNISWPEPLYVLDMLPQQNTLVVGEKHMLKKSTLLLNQFSLVNPEENILNQTIQVKLRYQMKPVKGYIQHLSPNQATLQLNTPMAAIAKGQACVLSQGTRIIGGGTISESY